MPDLWWVSGREGVVKWYIAETHCSICNLEEVHLFPGPCSEGFECTGCGYMVPLPPEMDEVPESFAKAEHKRFGLYWGKDGEYDPES